MTVNVSKPKINLREELSRLNLDPGMAGRKLLSAETVEEQHKLLGINGRRNYIINGQFDIWQRGSSVTGDSTIYWADHWTGYSGTTRTFSQDESEALSIGFRSCAKLVQGANDTSWYQRVEGVRNLAGKYVTLSFWAKSTVEHDVAPQKLEQDFGSGGSSLVSVILNPGETGNFRITTEWKKFTRTVYLPSVEGKTIGADNYILVYPFVFKGGYTYWVTGVQLEEGTVATPFEQLSFAEELALCQRYYQILAAGADYSVKYAGGSSHIIGTMHKWNSTNTFIFTDLQVSMYSDSLTLVKSGGASDFAFKSNGYTSTGNDLSLDGDSSNRSIRINSAVTNAGWPDGCSGWVRCNTTDAFVAIESEIPG